MRSVKIEKNACGGVGDMTLDCLLDAKQMNGKIGLYAQVTLPLGASLGYHEHHGNNEAYFILSGEGIYDDNGTKRVVKAGEVTWTPDGSGHGLDNVNGKVPLVFMALIVNS